MPIKIEAHPSATGIFTLTNPNSSTARSITLPDATGTVMLTDTPVNTTQLSTAFNATGSAPFYTCRAWVNFDGSAATINPRASGNISSVTDNGVGDYTLNFTSPMPDANYAALGTGSNNFSGFPPDFDLVTLTTTTCRFLTKATGNAVVAQDPVFTCFAIFR